MKSEVLKTKPMFQIQSPAKGEMKRKYNWEKYCCTKSFWYI